MPRSPRWTDEELAAAVAASATLAEVCRRLGLVPGRYDTLRRHIVRLGIDASHLPRSGQGGSRRRYPWTDEELVEAVRLSDSIAEVLRRLGCPQTGGHHRAISGKILNRGLDTSHFVGQSWARGRTRPYRPVMSLDEILVVNSTYTSTATLRRRLIKAGLKEARCESCGISERQGQPLALALDHINGVHTDNRLENLRILCPNCHALTDTWCVRNREPA